MTKYYPGVLNTFAKRSNTITIRRVKEVLCEGYPMGHRLTAACVRELERRVRSVFEARRGLPDDVYEAPYIGGEYRNRAPREQHADLMRKASKALCAQFLFDQTAPGWAKALGLPLRIEACEALQYNADNRLKLLGYFGLSWRWDDWDEQHPDLSTFGSGAMESRLSPMDIRNDPELQRMFSPRRLEGLVTPLHWRSPDR